VQHVGFKALRLIRSADIQKEWHTVHPEKQKIRHSVYRSTFITTVSRILILGKASDKFATLALLVG